MAASRWTARLVQAAVGLLLLEALLRLALISPSMRARLAPSSTGRSGAVRWAYERAFRTVQSLDTNLDVIFDDSLGWVAGTMSGVDEHGLRGVPLGPERWGCWATRSRGSWCLRVRDRRH